jgi:N4-gp56 family major capsid protein
VTPDSVAVADTQITLTLTEYGNVVKPTRFLKATSFLPFDPIVANVVGFNAAISVDTLAMNVLNNVANTGILYSDVAAHVTRVTQAATDIITSSVIRKIFATLSRANVMPFANGLYTSFIHPDVAVDLRGATDLAGWRAANLYVDTKNLMSGDMGEYEGFRFIRSPRAGVLVNTGSGAVVDVYQTLFFGQEAFAKAFGTGPDSPGAYPDVRPGPVVDPLYRFAPMGWYWIGSYGVFRQTALVRLETASSIANNTS